MKLQIFIYLYYRSTVFPYTKEMFQRWTDMGVKEKGYHVCGDTTRTSEDMAMTGATSISIDNKVDMQTAKLQIDNQVHLSGNLASLPYL